jgi:hypothetical protein
VRHGWIGGRKDGYKGGVKDLSSRAVYLVIYIAGFFFQKNSIMK